MARTPGQCRYRECLGSRSAGAVFICGLVRQITGALRNDACKVGRDACQACCEQTPPSPRNVNSVVASLVYGVTTEILKHGGGSPREIEEAARARQYVAKSLEFVSAACETPRRERHKIGLVGWNTPSGLGYQNRDIALNLPVDRWLVPRHARLPSLPDLPASCPMDHVPRNINHKHVRSWLAGLDWVLFVELPSIAELPQIAHELGVSVACVPNWEYADLERDWLNYVDAMICPTTYTYELIRDWKGRFGFDWEVVHVPWPVDTGRFRFRQRTRCRRFLFVNGTGGSPARRPNGTFTEYRRKGCDVLFQAAARIPRVPFIVYSQRHDVPPPPRNVVLRKAPRRNEQLYEDGDVCVQPSHWEGLGLQLLECQSAGLPLVTTNAPPMNEYRPLSAVPVAETELVSVYGSHPITANRVAPADLAQTLEELYETDIAEASRRARAFVLREHNWERARRLLRQRLVR